MESDLIKQDHRLSVAENIWRISSLTAYLDEDTKILLLPKLDSKRKVRVVDTKYELETYEDLMKVGVEEVVEEKESAKRFEDKTEEEVQDDVKRRRNKQFQSMQKIRKAQFSAICTLAFLYFFVYKRFLAPKSVYGGLVYNQAMRYIRKDRKI